ncbi:protein N-lysine methyltransferase METTL21C [Sarotherodon galilaeus]
MDPAACDSSEELRDDIIFSVENLLSLWLEHPPEELRRALETRLQRLFSGLPWLFGSLSPTIQAFLQHTPHLLSAIPASLPDSPDVILPGPSEPSAGRKCRSRRQRATPQPDIRTFNSPAVVSEDSFGLCDCSFWGLLPDSPVHSMQGEGFLSTQCTFQGLAAVGTVSHSRASPEAGSLSPADSGPLKIKQPPENHFMSALPGQSQCSVHCQSPLCQLVASMTAGLVMASAGGSEGPLRPLSRVSAGGSEGPLRPSSRVSAGGSGGPLRPSSSVFAGGSKGPVQPAAPPAPTPPPAAPPAPTPPPPVPPVSPGPGDRSGLRRQSSLEDPRDPSSLQRLRLPRRRLQRLRLRLPRRRLQRLRLRLPRRRLQRLRLRLPRRRLQRLRLRLPRRRLQRLRLRLPRRRLQRLRLRLPRRRLQRLRLRLPRQVQPHHPRQLQRLRLRLPRRRLRPPCLPLQHRQPHLVATVAFRTVSLRTSSITSFANDDAIAVLTVGPLNCFPVAAAAFRTAGLLNCLGSGAVGPLADPLNCFHVAAVAFRTAGPLNCFPVAAAAFRTAGPLNCLGSGAVGPLAVPLNCVHVAVLTAGPLRCSVLDCFPVL